MFSVCESVYDGNTGVAPVSRFALPLPSRLLLWLSLLGRSSGPFPRGVGCAPRPPSAQRQSRKMEDPTCSLSLSLTFPSCPCLARSISLLTHTHTPRTCRPLQRRHHMRQRGEVVGNESSASSPSRTSSPAVRTSGVFTHFIRIIASEYSAHALPPPFDLSYPRLHATPPGAREPAAPHPHAWLKSKRPGPSAVCKFDGEPRFRRENVQRGASFHG